MKTKKNVDRTLPPPPPPSQAEPPRRFHESAAVASWVFGSFILVFLMVVVFVEIHPSKYPILRFFMALSAALFAFFFVGGVLLQGTLRGVFISATGGFVLFILIQFVFDPFQFVKLSPAVPQSQATSVPGPTLLSKELTPSESSVNSLQDAILVLKGDYEAMLRTKGYARERAEERVYSEASKFAHQMSNISDSDLMMSVQVRKFEYSILAFYMAAAGAKETSEKIKLTNAAIAAAKSSLDRLKRAGELASTGNEFHVAKYKALLADDSFERIHWFYAVALAINARAGGEHTIREVREIFYLIPEPYRKQYPPETNPYLDWAINENTK